MSIYIICVEEVPSVRASRNFVSFEKCMATDACPSGEELRSVIKDQLEWWNTDEPASERLTEAEFVDQFGIKPKLGTVFLMIDGKYFDYQAPYMVMSSELFLRVQQGG